MSGFNWKYTGFHYDEGGWKLYYRISYSHDWTLHPTIFVDKQSAIREAMKLEKEWLIGQTERT